MFNQFINIYKAQIDILDANFPKRKQIFKLSLIKISILMKHKLKI